MKKYLFIFFMVSLLVVTTEKTHAENSLSQRYFKGEINNKITYESINKDSSYLLVPTTEGMYLVDQNTFIIKEYIKIVGTITDYQIIDNIEGNDKPNKDLLVFLEEDTLPSVIVYSLDTFDEIWSFTIFTETYNDESIKIDKKLSIFDYSIYKNNLFLAAGYDLYSLNINTGDVNWKFENSDNIWAVSVMGDINRDEIEDIAISVQPTSVIGIDGKNGRIIWENKIAKNYSIERDGKIIGSTKRNIWDIHYIDSKLILTSEDGYLYQVNPNIGNVIKEKSILEKIPNILAYTIYLEGNKAKDYSGLSTDLNSAYKIINSRTTIDVNNDNIHDLLVTVFEPNKYASYSNMLSKFYLIDGKTLDIIWENELDKGQIIDLHLYDNGDMSFFNGSNINIYNLINFEFKKEISLEMNKDQNNRLLMYPLLMNGNLYINNNGLIKVDISDVQNAIVLDQISYIDGYDTVTKDESIYKIYYQYDKKNKNFKNYKVIESINYLDELVYSYDLDNDLYFNKFEIVNTNGLNLFLFVGNDNQLYRINSKGEVRTSSFIHNADSIYPDNYLNVFTTSSDFNEDGFFDLLINYNNGYFYILNGTNLEDVIVEGNINQILNNNNEYFTHVLPRFITNKNQLTVISNTSLEILEFDKKMNFNQIKKVSFEDYNFWDDGLTIKNHIDFDKDGHNEIVLKLNNNEKNKALVVFSKDDTIGSFYTGWDFSLYETDDLNNDGINETIITTTNEDEEGNWQSVSKIINPAGDNDVLFTRTFNEGNNYTHNSQYKSLTIVDDLTGDNSKDVLVMVERWGDSYIQIYNINDDKNVKKIIPLSVRFTEEDIMYDSFIGSPGGYINTLTIDNNEYMFLTYSDEMNFASTKLFHLDDLFTMQPIVSITGRLHDYKVSSNTILLDLVNKKNETNYHSIIVDITNVTELKNFNENNLYDSSYMRINWNNDENAAFYRIYIDGKLIEITKNNEIDLFLKDGMNQIGIGKVLKNKTEIITYYNLQVKSDYSVNRKLWIYTIVILGLIFLLPLKFRKITKKGAIK